MEKQSKISSNNNNNNEPPDWNFLIKFSTVVVYVTTVFVGIYQFNYEQQKNTELEYKKIRANDSVNFQNSIWEKKLKVYTKIGKSIGKIVSIEDKDTIPTKLVKEFEELYYGEAILVEDSVINKSLAHFRRSVYDYKSGFISGFQLKEIGMHLAEELKSAIHERKR